jgi:hypothetical protein
VSGEEKYTREDTDLECMKVNLNLDTVEKRFGIKGNGIQEEGEACEEGCGRFDDDCKTVCKNNPPLTHRPNVLNPGHASFEAQEKYRSSSTKIILIIIIVIIVVVIIVLTSYFTQSAKNAPIIANHPLVRPEGVKKGRTSKADDPDKRSQLEV